MIENFNDKKKKRDDAIVLTGILLTLCFIVFMVIPPYDKVAQLGYTFNNLKYTCSGKLKAQYDDAVFHRNQAIYLARMNSKHQSLKYMNKAIVLASGSATEEQLKSMYRDSAYIKLYFSDYKGALSDYLKSGHPAFNDRLTIAQLFKVNGNNSQAMTYCNSIINTDVKAYAGYACLADLYASSGKYDASIRIYDLYIDRAGTKPRALADRAYYKNMNGDIDGANNDLKAAQDLSPNITDKITILEDALKPKYLKLSII